MKSKLLLLMFFLNLSFIMYAQDENDTFVKSFTKVIIVRGENDEEREELDKKTTFVFNHGKGKDIKVYQQQRIFILKTISTVKEGMSEDGYKYQHLKVLDEEGEEAELLLYDEGIIRLIHFSSDSGNLIGNVYYIP